MSTFSTFDSTVNSFYLAFYGRPADPAGLAFWSKQLAANNGELSHITQAFATSEEAQVRFGTDTVADRIAEIYEQLFNRAPEAAGLAYWTDVVAQGHASMADVAVAILDGARGTDASLSVLRQQAADAFTAAVDAGATQYSGYASIEAARILVRAVTPDATAADLDALVKAAVSFADTATRTPQVVDAIAVNTTLLALFDTARGKSEPVGLAQALADTAKAAAGDPVTLESLLRGGGMDKVLKVMPAKATLKDVVDALAAGGLPAAVDVVYPTAPVKPVPTPTFSFDLSFKTVTHDKLDLHDDNVTNADVADVTFTYTGRALTASQHVEYSVDGKNWIKTGIDTSKPNTVVLEGVQLAPQHHGIPDARVSSVATFGAYQDTVTTISLRAVDASGVTSQTFVQDVVYDGHAAAPVVTLKQDTAGKTFGTGDDLVTSKAALVVDGLEKDATVQYLVLAKQQVVETLAIGSVTTLDLPDLWTDKPVFVEGDNTVRVRQIDVAGNISHHEEITFTLDTTAPSKVGVSLVSDTGSSTTDHVTNSGLVKISGLETGGATAWEYSIDGGKSWTFGDVGTDHATAILDLAAGKAADGIKNVVVRQVDLTGNVGEQSDLLTLTLDTTAPANALGFVSLGGAQAGSLATTLEEADVVFSYDGVLEQGSKVEFRIGDDDWSALHPSRYVDGTITVPVTDLKGGDPSVAVRIVDSAGNAGEPFGVVVDGPAIQGTLKVSAMLGTDLIGVTSGITGQLYLRSGNVDTALTIDGLPGLVSKDVTAYVGVQEHIVSGVLKVANASTILTEEKGIVVGLGTKGDDATLEGNFILGFAGNDKLTGTDASDYLDGGVGNDTIHGGKGADFTLVNGNDTLVYTSTADSNLSNLLYVGSGTTTPELVQTTDQVWVMPGSTVTFDLGTLPDVQAAHNAVMPVMMSGVAETTFAMLTSAYHATTKSDTDAVLFKTMGNNTQMLVVNNGDAVIDQNDLVVMITGSGEITLDATGNVVFGPFLI